MFQELIVETPEQPAQQWGAWVRGLRARHISKPEGGAAPRWGGMGRGDPNAVMGMLSGLVPCTTGLEGFLGMWLVICSPHVSRTWSQASLAHPWR